MAYCLLSFGHLLSLVGFLLPVGGGSLVFACYVVVFIYVVVCGVFWFFSVCSLVSLMSSCSVCCRVAVSSHGRVVLV